MADSLQRVGLVFKADGTVDFRKSLKDVNASIQENRTEFKLAKSTWDKSTKAVEKLKASQEYLGKQTEDYNRKVRLLREELNDLENAEERDEAAIQKKRAQLNTAETSLNNYRRGLEEVNEKLKTGAAQIEEFAGKVEKLGSKMTDAGKKMTVGVTTPIVGIGVAAGKAAIEFEDSMAKVSTIADTTNIPIKELENAIVELSDQTGIAAGEIAGNVYDAISAGQKTGDAVNFVSNATKLAKAGFTSTDSALDILTTTLNAYGMETEKVTEVSDTLITTQNLGKTTVDELAASMGKIIPTAKANGVALDQVATGYAIMTANGVATAETTTYMNSMFNEMGKSGTKVAEVLKKKTGKSFSELMREGKSVSEVLEIVNTSAKEQNLAFTDLWGSAEAGKAALILLGDGVGNFNGVLEQMRNSTGATDEAFEKMKTTSYDIDIAVNQLKNAAMDLGEILMETLAPIIQETASGVKEFSEWFKSLDEEQKKAIVTIGLIIAAIGPLLVVFGSVFGGISKIIGGSKDLIKLFVEGGPKVKDAFGTVGDGAKGLWAILTANPIGIIITAIGLLIGVLVTAYNKCEWFRNGVDKFFKDAADFLKVSEKILKKRERIS